ncbi:MAG: M20/M25/M40 family metallo-hydrolase [Deltaproteobacteria bacterium]
MVHRFGSILFDEKPPAISEDWLRRRRNHITALCAAAYLAGFAILAIYQIQPPKAESADAPATQFSAARASTYLEVIAARPHPTGSPENVSVREYLSKQLTGLGLEPQVEDATVVRYEMRWRGPAVAAYVHNVVARLKGVRASSGDGSASAKALMLVAHYDSVASGPGASDDGSGAATLLETARALKAGPSLQNDVIFLFTDGEELGLLGAQAFVDEHPWAKDAGVVLNFEARGSCGPVTMFETSDGNGRLIDEFARAAPHAVTSSLMYEAYKMLPNDTDLSIFKKAGMPGLNFAYAGCWPRYHTMGDNLQNLSQRSLQHDGDYALALARSFGNSDLTQFSIPADQSSSHRSGNAVYFSLIGRTIHYSSRWALPLALLSFIILLAACALGIRKGRMGLRGILVGFILWPLAALAASLGPEILWVVLRKSGFASLLPYGMAYNGGLYTVGFIALAVAVFSGVYVVAAKRAAVENLVAGALLWWALLELASIVLAPGASFVFVWPLLAAALAMGAGVLIRGSDSEPRRALVWALPSAAVILILVPIVILLVELLGTTGLVPIVLTISLLLGLLIPYFRVISSEERWPIPVAACGIATGFVVFAMFASGYNVGHARADTIFYFENADTHRAFWGTTDGSLDAWTAQFFKGASSHAKLSDFLPLDEPIISSQATPADLPPPDLKSLGDVALGDERLLRLSITSPRRARVFWISVTQGTVLEGSVGGKLIPASGQKPGNWGLVLVGAPESGATLVLHLKSVQPLAIRVSDQTDGLPDLQSDPFKPRPASFMPAPGPFDSSTLVSKTFAFESLAAPAPASKTVPRH